MARATNRLRAVAGAIGQSIRRSRLASRPANPGKILVLHELLLGDTLMLAPLLAALRRRHPKAEIMVTARPGYAGLFSGRPYGAHVLPFSEREPGALSRLSAARDCDIAILPGETRLAILARALGAKWVVACEGSKQGWNSRATDERIAFSARPMALADMFARLAGPSGEIEPLLYSEGDWPAPGFAPFDRPDVPYAVLHVGAGSPLRLWAPGKWRTLADAIFARGLGVVWSAGRDECGLVREIDPDGRYKSYAGQLDLPQLWHLLSGADLAVTLDTGIAHMAKLTRTPTAALFGPGSAELFGKGEFWRDNAYIELTAPGIPCRDQRHLFKREIDWVRRCNRTPEFCPRPRCMEAIAVDQVIAALQVEYRP